MKWQLLFMALFHDQLAVLPEELLRSIWGKLWDNFLRFSIKTYCGYSLEAQQGASDKYPQYMILWRNKKKCPRTIAKYSS